MRKIMMVLAIVLMTAALVFTGCKRQSDSSTASGSQLTTSTAVTVEVFDRGTDGGRTNAADNYWTQWIIDKVKKDLGLDVTFMPVGRWSETTDIVNLLASNSAPDLCYTYNTGMIANFRDQGGILNLAPYIDSHLPDFKSLLGSDPALGGDLVYRDIDPATGTISSVPSVVVNIPQRNIFIRKDWLDKLGLPLPRTTQEFYNALVAFRDQDPGNLGRTNVIPYGQDSDARWGFLSIVYAFVDPNLSDRDRWINGFTDRTILLPGYKEGMRMMNQWYNEGLIFRDFPIITVADDYFALLKTGRVGAYSGNWDHPYRVDYNIQVELAQNVPGAEFVAVDCIQSSDGITHKTISDKPGLRIFVPAASKNQDGALKYLNWLSKYENYHYLQVGDQGTHHNIVNGVPQVVAVTGPRIMNSPNNIDLTIPMNGIEMGSADLNARVLALNYGSIPAATIVNAYNMSIVNGKAPSVYQAAETQLGIYSQDLMDKADALIAQAVTGPVADFDRIWDAGIQDYLRSGGQAVIDERTRLWPR